MWDICGATIGCMFTMFATNVQGGVNNLRVSAFGFSHSPDHFRIMNVLLSRKFLGMSGDDRSEDGPEYILHGFIDKRSRFIVNNAVYRRVLSQSAPVGWGKVVDVANKDAFWPYAYDEASRHAGLRLNSCTPIAWEIEPLDESKYSITNQAGVVNITIDPPKVEADYARVFKMMNGLTDLFCDSIIAIKVGTTDYDAFRLTQARMPLIPLNGANFLSHGNLFYYRTLNPLVNLDRTIRDTVGGTAKIVISINKMLGSHEFNTKVYGRRFDAAANQAWEGLLNWCGKNVSS